MSGIPQYPSAVTTIPATAALRVPQSYLPIFAVNGISSNRYSL